MDEIVNRFMNEPADRQKPLLEVLVVYEDLATGKRAKAMLDGLSKRFGLSLGLTTKLWRFDHLQVPWLQEQAAVEAAGADVIILSVHRKTEMSEMEREWMNRWLDHKEDRPYMFCVLLGSESGGAATDNPLLAEMKGFATAAGVDFFSDAGETPFAATDGSFENLHERANRISSVLDGILSQDVNKLSHASWRHGR